MRRERGFTIIEFMIAMTLSLLVLAALTAAFVASSRSRAEIEKANEQIENGRFALQILTDDLEMAGFMSHFDIDLAMSADTNKIVAPGSKPNPCAASLANLRAALPMHIQGYDNLAALGSELDDCLADFKAGTDIVAIRRTATCVGGTANCAPAPGGGAPFFQAALCETQLGSLDANNYYKLETTVGNLNRTGRNCATTADRRQYLVHIYFVANNDLAGDGIPTLKRAELVAATGTPASDFTIASLAHGVEDLQLDYGVDTSGDGAPDVFTSSPDTYDAPGGTSGPYGACSDHNAECVSNWRNVVAMRINLLARNTSETPDHVDVKVYILGQNDDGTDRCEVDVNADGTCEAIGGGYKRHVYQTSVRLNNPAGRRES
ncbi:MAG: PilW family protein [Nevskiaceae bacterium]